MADATLRPGWTRYERLLWPPDRIAVAFILIGALVRLRQWWFSRSLWLDEAMLALNVLRRGFAGLLGPLDYNQLAPHGYLCIVKATTWVAGPGEASLRFVALFAGVAAMAVVWRLTRRIFGPWSGAASAATMALGPGAIYFSNEVKPYASDALVSAALLSLGVLLVAKPLRWTHIVLLTAVGSVAVWLSYPAPFTLAGLALGLAASCRQRGDRQALLGVCAAGLMWMGAWWLLYRLAMTASTYTYMHQYWQDSFLRVSLSSPYSLARATIEILNLIAAPFDSPLDPWSTASRLTALLLVLAVVGAGVLVRERSWARLCLLATGPLALLAAAAAQLYPLDGRLALFMLPGIVALSSGGLSALAANGQAWPALLAALVSLSWPAVGAAQTLLHPDEREDVRTLLGTLSTESRPGDTVYVWRGLRAPVEYYELTRPGLWRHDLNVVSGTPGAMSPERYLADIDGLCPTRRAWLLATHPLPAEAYQIVVATLGLRGEVTSVQQAAQSTLRLLDLHCLPSKAAPEEAHDGAATNR